MDTLYYAYPITNKVSFHFISKQHIRYMRKILRNKVRILEVEVDTFDPTLWGFDRKLIIHPLFYPFFTGVNEKAKAKVNKLKQCINKGYRLVAFETADSDRISEMAVELANSVEALFVPSNFAMKAYIESGVYRPVYVVPHGVPDEFLRKDRRITNPEILRIKQIKDKNNLILVHFNLSHSGLRKGADLFIKAMQFVQEEDKDIAVLLKRGDNIDNFVWDLRRMRTIEVAGYLDMDSYRQLYDISDIVVLTSRGGGFECIAIEGLARGIPTIVPKAGCFLDYIEYAIPVPVTDNKPIVLPNNPIHIGRGWEIDVYKLASTILKVANNIDKYKKKADKVALKVRKKFYWGNIAKQIINILNNLGIIEV